MSLECRIVLNVVLVSLLSAYWGFSYADAQEQNGRVDGVDVTADDGDAAVNNLGDLEKRLGIEIVTESPRFPVKTNHGLIEGKPSDREAIDRYAALFLSEFQIYPPALIKRTRLRRVVFCEELAFAGQRRNAIPDFNHNTLYLEIRRGRGNERYLRGVIHHEFFHLIDYRDDGKIYQDSRWAALNPASFQYGNGGKNAQNISTTAMLTDTYPGFLNHYSTTGVEEDKAEIFANLIVNPTYVEGRVASDGVLKAKVAVMKELLTEFCPDVDEEFWKNAKSKNAKSVTR